MDRAVGNEHSQQLDCVEGDAARMVDKSIHQRVWSIGNDAPHQFAHGCRCERGEMRSDRVRTSRTPTWAPFQKLRPAERNDEQWR